MHGSEKSHWAAKKSQDMHLHLILVSWQMVNRQDVCHGTAGHISMHSSEGGNKETITFFLAEPTIQRRFHVHFHGGCAESSFNVQVALWQLDLKVHFERLVLR